LRSVGCNPFFAARSASRLPRQTAAFPLPCAKPARACATGGHRQAPPTCWQQLLTHKLRWRYQFAVSELAVCHHPFNPIVFVGVYLTDSSASACPAFASGFAASLGCRTGPNGSVVGTVFPHRIDAASHAAEILSMHDDCRIRSRLQRAPV